MNSYIDLGEGRIQMPFGILGGVTSCENFDTGALRSVKLSEKNVIVTHAGELYAAYTETPRRKNKPSVQFFRSGLVSAVALEEQQEVLTPIGSLPAELVTFYDSGELHRVFPVDGQLSGFWSEEDERGANIPLTFDLDFTVFTAMLSCVCFYISGDIKSITLFPGETVPVRTALGTFNVRHGFSLYECGALRSFEPAAPTKINTPIGTVIAFDPLSTGICADSGSVVLTEDGRIHEISTAANSIAVQTADSLYWHVPVAAPHPCSDEKTFHRPIKIAFDYADGTVSITDTSCHAYAMETAHFSIIPFDSGDFGCSPADCASCSLCSG